MLQVYTFNCWDLIRYGYTLYIDWILKFSALDNLILKKKNESFDLPSP